LRNTGRGARPLPLRFGARRAFDAPFRRRDQIPICSVPDPRQIMIAHDLRRIAACTLLLPALALSTPVRAAFAAGGTAAPLAQQEPVSSHSAARERPFAACLAQESGPVQVFGMINEETGDTMAVLRGSRVALRTAYPAVPSAAATRWFAQGDAIQLAGVTYARYGAPRELAPGAVGPFARYAGVPVYASAGSTRPASVFVPLDGCRFQEFRTRSRG